MDHGDKQDWFMTGSAACSLPPQASARRRNAAAVKADRAAFLN